MKYKYYIKQPKGEIVRDMLFWIGGAGVALSAIMAPKAFPYIVRAFVKQFPRTSYKSAATVFQRLLKEESIQVDRSKKQIYIFLTKHGCRRAGRFQINSLGIKKQKRWDGQWRVLIFDIPHTSRFIREALRGFLKRLNFYQLQKSVWVHPYDCKDEIDLLRDFFGLSFAQLQLLLTKDISDDSSLKKYFFRSETLT